MSEVNFPGHINIGGDSYYSGCKAIEFRTADEFNRFFQDNFGLLCVKVIPLDGGITVLYTKALSDEELKDFQESHDEAQKIMDKKRAARAEKNAELAVKKEAQEKEEKRLVALGRACEKNHPKKGKGHE